MLHLQLKKKQAEQRKEHNNDNDNDLGKNRGKINHLLYMDDLKLYARNKKETDPLITTTQIYSKDICMEFGISKCAHITLQRELR